MPSSTIRNPEISTIFIPAGAIPQYAESCQFRFPKMPVAWPAQQSHDFMGSFELAPV
jgi:hypothetical protein